MNDLARCTNKEDLEKSETLRFLFREHAEDTRKLHEISTLFNTEDRSGLVQHFIKANAPDMRGTVERLFTLEPAIAALDASYWQRALDLTDVLESMPRSRRDAWHTAIDQCETPPFSEENVLVTLQDLLANRSRFFAERVDGVFQNLSHDHVTNRPEGFSKRLILSHVYSGIGQCYRTAGHVHDLRCVVARIMKQPEPRMRATNNVVEYAHNRDHRGQWVTLDGGSLRIRMYGNGNAHLEVHPEIADKLNNILAKLHPHAIATPRRTKKKTSAPKDFRLYDRPIPAPVLEHLFAGRWRDNTFTFGYDTSIDKRTHKEASDILCMLGAVPVGGAFRFSYGAEPTVKQIIVSGVIPDAAAYQFYPTPLPLAEEVVQRAQIEDRSTVLEPSAGHGNLADLLPRDRTTLVEICELHCKILREKGYAPIKTDFLNWRPRTRWDRIVMNPPFSEGRWQRHVERASALLSSGAFSCRFYPPAPDGELCCPGGPPHGQIRPRSPGPPSKCR